MFCAVFILLTIFIILICILLVQNDLKYRLSKFNLLVIGLGLLISGVFFVDNILVFYVLFELTVLPMFGVIRLYGARVQKVKAGWYLLFFTLFGSVFFLFSTFLVFYYVGSLNFFDVVLGKRLRPLLVQKVVWWGFRITFFVKLPLLPFHIWLPEAHVEAPTVGSIILARLLLKLGSFGFLKYNVFLFPELTWMFSSRVLVIALVSLVYASIRTLRQLDIKRIIAYSSVAHISVVLIGLITLKTIGVVGSVVIIIAHAVVSSALFLLIGVLYNRYHTRFIGRYGGLRSVMPLFSIFWFLRLVSNFSFPLTSNFFAELMIIVGLAESNLLGVVVVCFCGFLTMSYCLWVFSRTRFGTIRVLGFQSFSDLTRLEFVVLVIFLLWNIFLGVFPQIVVVFCEPAILFFLN
jgi:proton-translocating NADH-quinone oxidoreductase chain M